MTEHEQRPGDQLTLDAYAELSRLLLHEMTMLAVLTRVAELTRRVLPEIADASITLVRNGKPGTVVFTTPLAIDLDERQYENGFGPCVDAALSGETIVESYTDGADDGSDYPHFAAAARRLGITQILAVGLPVPQRITGALNL